MDNKYSTYRKIRYDRTYRPLGKMTWWRVVAGIALLIFVLLLSGTVSQAFALYGKYAAADALMISPGWMEQYKPEVKAWIEGGLLFEDGDYEKAWELLGPISGLAAAGEVRSACALRLGAERFSAGDCDGTWDCLSEADPLLLSSEGQEEYRTLCAALYEHDISEENDRASLVEERLLSLGDAVSEDSST